MATESDHEKMKFVTVSRKEAVEIIGLLAAQLGEVALPGNASGAVPSINISECGVIKYRLVLCVE